MEEEEGGWGARKEGGLKPGPTTGAKTRPTLSVFTFFLCVVEESFFFAAAAVVVFFFSFRFPPPAPRFSLSAFGPLPHGSLLLGKHRLVPNHSLKSMYS